MICMQWLGSIEHLIRILTDMTNAVEELHMKWKEKSLKIVAGPTQITSQDRRLRLSAKTVENTFGTWWMGWRRSVHGSTIVEVLKQVCGTGSRRETLSSTRRRRYSVIPKSRSTNALIPSTLRVYLLYFMALESGHIRKGCSTRCDL